MEKLGTEYTRNCVNRQTGNDLKDDFMPSACSFDAFKVTGAFPHCVSSISEAARQSPNFCQTRNMLGAFCFRKQ